MKRSNLLLTLGGLALLGMSARACLVSPPLTPTEVLEIARARLEQPVYEERRTLRDVQRAFEYARAAGDRETAAELLRVHASILGDLGAFTDARADLMRVLEEFRPGDDALELDLALLSHREGQTDEGLARVRRVLGRSPDYGAAWRLDAELSAARGESELASALGAAQGVLFASQMAEARELLESLGSHSVRDPERIAVASRLRALFPERKDLDIATVLDHADAASARFDRARSSWARSFEDELEPAAAASFLRVLGRAGRDDLAADFGMAALGLEELHGHPQTGLELFSALDNMGRHETLERILARWPWKQLNADLDFYLVTARMLRELGAWQVLPQALNSIVRLGTEVHVSYSHVYMAEAGMAMGRPDKALDRARKYLQRLDPYEPYPGAIGVAYRVMAEAKRTEDPAGEREALLGAVQHGSATGEDLLRLAELESGARNSGFRVPEERWTQAMSLLPERTDELMERWEDLGRKSLAADSRDFDALIARMERQNLGLPAVDVGPQTLWRVARWHLDSRHSAAALRVASELLEVYPHLLPAIDVRIEGELMRRNEDAAAAQVIERLALVGRDARTSKYLQDLGDEVFSPAQRLQMMRVDPTGTGRLFIARYLIEHGQEQRGLRALEATENERPSPEEALLAARALLVTRREAEAAETLERIAGDPVHGENALRLLVEARLAAGPEDRIEAFVGGLASLDAPSSVLLLEAADKLLATDRAQLARLILERMDREPELRSGEVLLRLAVADSLYLDRRRALESLARAEAFIGDGRPEFLRLLFAIEDRDWAALPGLVRELRATRLESSDLSSAVLALLEERLDAARALAERGLAEEPRSAAWALILAATQSLARQPVLLPLYFGEEIGPDAGEFLRGSGELARDPREILRLLLALDDPLWTAWALPRIEALVGENPNSAFGLWLQARAQLLQGDSRAARRSLGRLTTRAKRFGPGWDDLIVLVESESDDPLTEELTQLRSKRLAVLGEALAGTPLENSVVRSAELAVKERTALAIRTLERMLPAGTGGADSALGRLLLARLFVADGNIADAMPHYVRACSFLPEGSSHELVAEFVDVLAGAVGGKKESGVSDERLRSALTRLEDRFPDDPLVVLAQARRSFELEKRTPALAVARALSRLELLQRRSREPLAVLRPGSAVAWADFLSEVAPQKAEELVREELLQTPGHLDLWLLLARTLEQRRQSDEAFRLYETIVAQSDDPQAHEALAWLLASRGEDQAEVQLHLDIADRDGAVSNERSRFIRTRADLESRAPKWDAIVHELELLWKARAKAPRGKRGESPRNRLEKVGETELGRALVRALMGRGKPDDLAQARALCQELQRVGDSYERDTFRALGALARQLKDR